MIIFVNSADFGFGVTYGRLEFGSEVALPTGTMTTQFKVPARPSFSLPARPNFSVPTRPEFKVGG